MKKLIPLLFAVTFVFAGTMEPPRAEKVTVSGKLIDTKCYGMMHANHPNEHTVMKDGKKMQMPGCATACATMGIPVGLLEDSKPGNTVYVVITPATGLAKHMAKPARITGELAYPGGIIPDKIEVKNAEGKWEEVHIATMM